MRHRGSHLVDWLQGCAAAFQLLTRIPVPVRLEYHDRLFRRSAVFYPLVGAVLGVLLAAASLLLAMVLPPLAAAVLVLGLWLALTGGLHMDGLMDTADGVLSHRSRERMLEIMKDSRVGAMGVLAGGWQLLLKAALLAALLEDAPRSVLAAVLVLAPVWSRAFMVAAIAGWPYAREGEGMGRLMAGVTRREAGIAVLVASVLSLLALVVPFAFPLSALLTVTAGSLALAAGWLLARRIAGKLGGLTGDTYGALNELLESWLLLLAVAGVYTFYT